MKQVNKKISITTRAKNSSGRVRCDKCEFYNKCRNTHGILVICNAIYIKAYVKGYRQSIKDHKKLITYGKDNK